MAEKQGAGNRGAEQRREGELQRSSGQTRGVSHSRDPFDVFSFGPFATMRRMQEGIDRLFSGFGTGLSPFGEEASFDWAPAIEAFQRGNEFVVRADVPGLSRDNLSVEVGDNALTIRGERKFDHEEEREGVFRSERAYGSFCRVVPLPEGAVADSAKANFRDGVLEIVMQAPSQEVRRGRRIEIEGERSEQRPEQKR
jgi:HSP20 family protein